MVAGTIERFLNNGTAPGGVRGRCSDADIVSVAESERSAKTYTSSGRANPFDDSDGDTASAGDAAKPIQSKDPKAVCGRGAGGAGPALAVLIW